MVQFNYQGRHFSIDNKLAYQLDTKIIPDLMKKDKDAVFLVDGGERKGKSVFTQTVMAYLGYRMGVMINLSNICMTPQEFREKVEKSSKNDIVVYDEAHRGMASSRSLSEINNILKDLMMEMGQKNLCVFIVLPTFFLLDKYAALFRSRGLFHIYERKGQRGYWVFYNEKNKLKLYMKGKKEYNYNCMKYPHFRGRFFNQYVVDEAEYRKKKGDSFKNRPRITKQEHFMLQRDTLIYILSKEYELSSVTISKLLKKYKVTLNGSILREIIGKMMTEMRDVPAGMPLPASNID